MQHVIVHNLFTYCSCAVARRNFCYVNVHNSLHFVAFSLSQAGNGDCGNKTTTKATNATKKIKRKITETKKTSFFHQKATWSCLSLSLSVSLPPDKPNQSNVRLRRTWQQAARQHQQGATPTRRVKTKRNDTRRCDTMRCHAMQKKNPPPPAAADDDVCYMVNFSCRFGPPTPTSTSNYSDSFGEYLQRRETRFRKRHWPRVTSIAPAVKTPDSEIISTISTRSFCLAMLQRGRGSVVGKHLIRLWAALRFSLSLPFISVSFSNESSS